MMNTRQDKIRGSLIGGAVGDALGYSVEFLSIDAIRRKYGKHGFNYGISRYQDFNSEGKAVVSDDTQMTLFTANGLLFGVTRFCTHGILGAGLKDYVAYAYQDWLETQDGNIDYAKYHYCWIRDVKELNVQRAPDETSMKALLDLKVNGKTMNDSKGSGGVMRVAPVGLMAAADVMTGRRHWDEREVARLGGDCAEITHKHPLGYLPAAFHALLVFMILTEADNHWSGHIRSALDCFIRNTMNILKEEYTSEREQWALEVLEGLLRKAVRLSEDSTFEPDAISQLGEGWTADEALAIAIYCAMKHTGNFENAVTAAVNHSGDSDTTGAVCGNIMGAIVGYSGIPEHFTDNLELRELVIELADDIVHGPNISEYHPAETEEEIKWEVKYVKNEIPCQELHHDSTPTYHVIPAALVQQRISRLVKEFDSADEGVRYAKGYEMAMSVYDTDTFRPLEKLPYHRMCEEPEVFSMLKEYLPAYYYGYSDKKYSPRNNYRVFKVNLLCFEGKNPVIAVRDDCNCQKTYQLQAGLVKFDDKSAADKYPGWEFYMIDPSTADGHYAVFTNELEKEFAVEIAHLGEDGSLHRIYHLFY